MQRRNVDPKLALLCETALLNGELSEDFKLYQICYHLFQRLF